MRNLTLLVYKDFICAVSSFGNFAFLLVIWLFVMSLAPSAAPMMFVIITYLLIFTLFQTEENDLVCNVIAILPVRKEQTVIARYLYLYLVLGAQFILASILAPAVLALRGIRQDWLTPIMLGSAISLLMTSVMMPLFYRFGMIKMRIIAIAAYLVAILGVNILSPVLRLLSPQSVMQGVPLVLAGAVLLSLASLYISTRIKRRI